MKKEKKEKNKKNHEITLCDSCMYDGWGGFDNINSYD